MEWQRQNSRPENGGRQFNQIIFVMELKFEKETITKLDEQQMSEVNGGSSLPCWKLAYEVATLVSLVATGGVELSWWACDPNGGGGGGDNQKPEDSYNNSICPGC
ncbi:MAG TPA: class I lanthipeptide [Salinivirgaceae bacterium]|nr:class I lanthipeptide [Salinivirgaceae bacterium]